MVIAFCNSGDCHNLGALVVITLYDNGCTPCLRKQLWRELKAKCAEKRVLLSRKDTSKDVQARNDANTLYGMAAPFIVLENGQAVSVMEFLND